MRRGAELAPDRGAPPVPTSASCSSRARRTRPQDGREAPAAPPGGLLGAVLDILVLCQEAGLVTLGRVILDGTTLHYFQTSTAIPTLHNGAPHQAEVAVVGGRLQVKVAGVQVLDTGVSVPANVLVGFSAATGGRTNRHLVSAVKVGSGH